MSALAAMAASSRKRSRPTDDQWTITRCATGGNFESRKALETAAGKNDFRQAAGTSKSKPAKAEVGSLIVKEDGVYTLCAGGLFGGKQHVQDYNHFRASGYSGGKNIAGFPKGSNHRAVSLSTTASYDAMRAALPDATIRDGDLGENLIVDGPGWQIGEGGLSVGSVLRLGDTTTIELSEVNMPCYRMAHLPWAAAALARWPRKEDAKWWKHPDCPLSRPGGRGWLARVLVTGEVAAGDTVAAQCDKA